MRNFGVNFRVLAAGSFVFALVAGLGVFKASADSWDKKTVLTINEPVQVRDTLLEPGTYVFKLYSSPSERHVVQIFNEDQTHLVSTILAVPNYRLEPTGKTRFRFWETPPGHAKALRAWFYPGDNFGQEFPYPKHLAVTEMASASVGTTHDPEPAPTARVSPYNEAPPPTPTERIVPVEPSTPVEPRPQPQEMARSTAPATEAAPAPYSPPASVEASPEPASPAPQAPTPMPQTLPKTASTYPLFGFAGLCCMGVFAVVREKGARRRS